MTVIKINTELINKLFAAAIEIGCKAYKDEMLCNHISFKVGGPCPLLIEPKNEQKAITMWNDISLFETTQRMAKLLSMSNIAPQSYRGNVADCTIAIDIANRMGLSPLVVMQNSQVVHGNFSWKGTASKAMICPINRPIILKFIAQKTPFMQKCR